MAENILSDARGLTPLSVSDTGTLVYRARFDEAIQRRLVWLDRSGKEIQNIDDRDPVNSGQMSLSPDGRRLAVQHQRSIWMLDTERGLLTRWTTDQSGLPLWTPDGDRLVFQSIRDDVRNLYQRALTGTEDELLLATPGSKSPHDFSPDGRFLLYRDVDPRTGFDLWVMPLERDAVGRLRLAQGKKPMPVAQTPAGEMNGQFSPDAAWIAYQSDESGRDEIYVQHFGRPGAREQMSIDGGTQARWRRDGTELYYVSPEGQMMAVPIRRASSRQSINAGTPVPLFPVRVETGATPYHQYEVARDGQRFLVNSVISASPGVISAIVNWAPPH